MNSLPFTDRTIAAKATTASMIARHDRNGTYEGIGEWSTGHHIHPTISLITRGSIQSDNNQIRDCVSRPVIPIEAQHGDTV
jgi:hypothetical protein